MYTFFVFVEIIVSVLLIVVILMQSSKGGGLAGTFAGGSMGTVFGVRRTADFLGKATGYLAFTFIVLCLIINLFFLPRSKTGTESILQSGSTTTAPRPVPPTSQPAATPSKQAPQQGK